MTLGCVRNQGASSSSSEPGAFGGGGRKGKGANLWLGLSGGRPLPCRFRLWESSAPFPLAVRTLRRVFLCPCLGTVFLSGAASTFGDSKRRSSEPSNRKRASFLHFSARFPFSYPSGSFFSPPSSVQCEEISKLNLVTIDRNLLAQRRYFCFK